MKKIFFISCILSQLVITANAQNAKYSKEDHPEFAINSSAIDDKFDYGDINVTAGTVRLDGFRDKSTKVLSVTDEDRKIKFERYPPGHENHEFDFKVTEIAAGAFLDLTDLQEASITLNKIDVIPNNLFKDLKKLERISFGGNFTEIGGYVCSGCENLKIVAIPESVKKIGYKAFGDADKITDIYVYWTTKESMPTTVRKQNASKMEAQDLFEFFSPELKGKVKLHVPKKYIDIYKKSYWNEFIITGD